MLTPEQLRVALAKPLEPYKPRCRFGQQHFWAGTLVSDVFVCVTCNAISDERKDGEG